MPRKAQTSELRDNLTRSTSKLIISFDPKGGSGKTTTARGAAYALMQDGSPFSIIDADHENPDVFKEHMRWDEAARCFVKRNERIDVFGRPLRRPSDLTELGTLLEGISGSVLVNTPAGSGKELLTYWPDILDVSKATERSVITLFPIDRGRDTVESLRDYVESMVDEQRHPHHRIVVLKNLFFGEEQRFTRFDAWAKSHQPAAMAVRVWPELNEFVVDKLVETRARLDEDGGLSIAERSALRRYQHTVLALMRDVGVIA